MQKTTNQSDKKIMAGRVYLGCSILFFTSQVIAMPGFPKADLRGNASENFSSQGASLTLSAERSRYYYHEPIPITLKISNRGYYPITLYLHRNYLKNFTLVARTPQGRTLPVKDRSFDQHPDEDYLDAFYQQYTATNFHSRAIVLRPGESLERVINLPDLVELPEETTKLQISAFFYPNPEQSPELFLESENSLPILLDKKQVTPSQILNPAQPVIALDEITPRETVYLALSAEYVRDWPNFFKFISLRDFIADYPEFARHYFSGTSEEQAQVLENFKRYLMTRTSHRLVKFEVLGEEGIRNEHRAQVKVRAIREIDGFRREFYYIYYLTKSNNFWKITGMLSQVTK